MSATKTENSEKSCSGWKWTLKVKAKHYAALFALIIPTFAGMAVFNYFPKWETIKFAFYRWDGMGIEEFRGFKNFYDALSGADPLFWQTFQLIGIMLAANAIKIWPSIFTAIAVHRMKSERWQYIYRILLVLPMVIPSLVWLLIWKTFYDPTVGILNSILRGTGLIHVLDWLDTAMPSLAATLGPVRESSFDVIFGSVWGALCVGVLLLSFRGGLKNFKLYTFWCVLVLIASWAILETPRFIIFALVTIAAGEIGSRHSFKGRSVLTWISVGIIALAAFFILTTVFWVEPTKAFNTDTPAWLGNTKLIIPSLLFWGFPWLFSVGVLIYLAGLQSISKDVYESADLDGAGSLSKMFNIELPLIMSQLRINLIFITITTLNDYGLVLLLLGPHGGPGNKGMVPGLYMFREAFINGRYGYACALGLILFAIILMLTIIYQKYLKVEK